MNNVVETIKKHQSLNSYDLFIDAKSDAHPILDELKSEQVLPVHDFQKHDQFTLSYKNNVLSVLFGNQKPICVDFFDHQVSRQALKTSRKDLSCKALGLKQSQNHLIDLTAGFGKDSYIVSKYFNKVTWVERNPIVYLLLDDGLKRLKQTNEDLGQKFDLYFSEADDHLNSSEFGSEFTFYFDFMFSDKKSKSNKEMFFLKHITRFDKSIDLKSIISKAVSKNPHRTVLKAKDFKSDLKVLQEYKGSTISYYVFK